MKNNYTIEKLINELNSINRGNQPSIEIYKKNILLTYLAYKIKLNNSEIINETVKDFISYIGDLTISDFINENLDVIDEEIILELCKYDEEVLVEFITKSEVPFDRMAPDSITPYGVIKLAQAILKINDNDVVLDACSGVGNFLVESICSNMNAKYTGIELNHLQAIISKIRFEILGNKVKMIENDLFSAAVDVQKYTKIFSNYPFGIKAKFVDNSAFLEVVNEEVPALIKSSNSDWLFNYRITKLLAEGGKAVAVMAMGGLWNTTDKEIREYFVKSGIIEAIIALPSKLFPGTNVNTAMIVFGKNNGTIKMIDARDIFTDNRRMNILLDSDVVKIDLAYRFKSSLSKDVTNDEIVNNDYFLDPQKYLINKVSFINAVEFGTLISSITRGSSITADELDAIATSEDTKLYYLALSNIKDGMISKNLPSIREIEKKQEKYCLKDGDIVISKIGQPFKIAVASIKKEEKILATGNMFVITLDNTKANPYYIKAFLESKAGIEELRSITVGSTIPTIGVAQLSKIHIPALPLEKQDEIAKKYIAVLGEIEKLQNKIEDKKKELNTIFSL